MRRFLSLALFVMALAVPGAAPADQGYPYPDMRVIETTKPFKELVAALKAAVPANEMLLVSQACGSCGAKNQGFIIPGNYVAGVFRNDFARRLFAIHVQAGIEAPIRFYVTEDSDGSATLSYRSPSAIFAAYGVPELEPLGAELDEVFAAIASDATR